MIFSESIHQCRQCLSRSFAGLGVAVPEEQTQAIAQLIIQSMSGSWRSFHTPKHIFELAKGGDAIEVLAALFHDTVYVQVDQCIADSISEYISPYIYEDSQEIFITNDLKLLEDPYFRVCAVTFGYQLGQALPLLGGQNEFLSALLAVQVLRYILPLQVLTQVVACIEATIPFRSQEQDGITCSDQLFVRLEKMNTLFHFSWSVRDMRDIVRRSVRLSNRDVENFSSEDPAVFLEVTWSLIPEANHQLKNFEIYSTKHYVSALQRMERFMSSLSVEVIFKHAHGEPSPAELSAMLMRAQKNLEIARLYLGLKLIPLALKEAFSLPDSRPLKNLDGFLPSYTPHGFPANSIEVTVIDLLKRRSGFDSEFDPSNSPLALYILEVAGLHQIRDLISRAKSFLTGELSAEDFLSTLPGDIKNTMSDAITLLA